MPFMTNCVACKKNQSPLLDVGDNEVYCSECGAKINNIPHFTKIQMKTIGQTRKAKKSPYAVRCDSCKKELMPFIDQKNQLACASCKNVHKNISIPFANLIRNVIAKGEEDI